MNGYILISRKMIESGIFQKPPLYLKVWIYLLARAQFKDYGELKRGELLTSIGEIQEACSYYVGFRKEKPSEKQIRSIIEWLKDPYEGTYERVYERENERAMIVTTKVKSGILVSICNFNDYQDPNFYEGDYEEPTKGSANRQRRVPDRAEPINEEGKKKEKKENNNKYIMPALGEFENVKLTEEELEKLKERFPYDWQERIDRLSAYMQSKGKRYKSHYATILTWARKDGADDGVRKKPRTEGNTTKPDGKSDPPKGWIIAG